MTTVIHDTDLDGVTLRINADKKVEAVGGGTAALDAAAETLTVGATVIPLERMTDAAGKCIGLAFACPGAPVNAAPVIALAGNDTETVLVNAVWADAGATATDAEDGPLTVVVTGGVDTAVPGVYTVTYTATDSAGAVATAVRTVTVAAGAVPTITLIGAVNETVNVGGAWVDAGVTAVDSEDGDLTAAVVVSGAVDTAVAGVYAVTYRVTDASGNTATVVRTVTVATNDTPVITIAGVNPLMLTVGDAFVPPAATAADTEDGDVSAGVTLVSNVDTAVAGSYQVVYSVADSAGNAATAILNVTVAPAACLAPAISLSAATSNLAPCQAFVEPVVTATDPQGAAVSVSSDLASVDLSVVGAHTITYTATNACGQSASATHTVTVGAFVNASATFDNTVAVGQVVSAAVVVGTFTVLQDGDYTFRQNYETHTGSNAAAQFGVGGALTTTVKKNGVAVGSIVSPASTTNAGWWKALKALSVDLDGLVVGDVVTVEYSSSGVKFQFKPTNVFKMEHRNPCSGYFTVLNPANPLAVTDIPVPAAGDYTLAIPALVKNGIPVASASMVIWKIEVLVDGVLVKTVGNNPMIAMGSFTSTAVSVPLPGLVAGAVVTVRIVPTGAANLTEALVLVAAEVKLTK